MKGGNVSKINAEFGKRLIDLLSLRVSEDERVCTSWGTKTALGLGATVRRILEEIEDGD